MTEPKKHTPGADKVAAMHAATAAASGTKHAQSEAGAGAEAKEVAGFIFDLYELKNMYANVRDGNYYSAMKEAVGILYRNFYPPAPTRRGVAAAMPEVRIADVDETCQKLEEYCEKIETEASAHPKASRGTPANASMEKGIELVSSDGLVAMIRLIMGMIKEWRGKTV